jgi:hypothetical protein
MSPLLVGVRSTGSHATPEPPSGYTARVSHNVEIAAENVATAKHAMPRASSELIHVYVDRSLV